MDKRKEEGMKEKEVEEEEEWEKKWSWKKRNNRQIQEKLGRRN